MKPKMSYPLLVGTSDVFIHIAAKLFRSTGVGTKVELAFVGEEDRRIASNHFTFSQVINAEASELWIISGRILVKSGFVGR
jgi:hypothetical protein